MIAKTIVRRLVSLKILTPTISLLSIPKYNFARKVEKAPVTFTSILEGEIKAQESNLTDVTEFQNEFKTQGWSIKKENTLVELSRTNGKYSIYLLSNIKSPTNFQNQEQEKPQEGQEQEQYDGDMNEVTICIVKSGSEKTMVVNTIVTEGFEISNISFASNYQTAKEKRLDIFSSNTYSGPEMQTVSDDLFESIYGFLEQECQVNNELLSKFADYCLDSEQQFYINWLKDLKSML